MYFIVLSSTEMVISLESKVQFCCGFHQNIALNALRAYIAIKNWIFISDSGSDSFCLIASHVYYIAIDMIWHSEKYQALSIFITCDIITHCYSSRNKSVPMFNISLSLYTLVIKIDIAKYHCLVMIMNKHVRDSIVCIHQAGLKLTTSNLAQTKD